MPFQHIIMYALHYLHDLDAYLIFCINIDLHILSEVVYNLDYFCRSSLMGTTLRVAPSKSYVSLVNYHV